MNSPLIPILLISYYMLAVVIIFTLLKKNVSGVRKIVWSIIVLTPFFGVVFYSAFFNPPKPLPSHKRMGVSAYITPGGKSGIDSDHGLPDPNNARNIRRKKSK